MATNKKMQGGGKMTPQPSQRKYLPPSDVPPSVPTGQTPTTAAKSGKSIKKKMKNGGSLTALKASNKRVGPVDPKGAFTTVQKKTLAGATTTAKLTKDKQLGATKQTAKYGAKMSKKK